MEITVKIEESRLTEFLNYLKKIDFVKDIQVGKSDQLEEIKNKKTSLAEREAKLNPAAREIWEGIKEGLEDVKHGRTRPIEELFKELREEREKEEKLEKENKAAQ
jgi:predicted transcriptional regulator